MLSLPPLLLISDSRRFPGALQRVAGRAAEGGLGWLQLREPGWGRERARSELEALRRSLPGLVLSVNDDAALAAELAIGLHLPQAAPRPQAARRPYGRSAHDLDAVRRAVDEGVDYLIFGTLFASSSKPGREGCGAEALGRACATAGATPVYAIGGVSAERVPELLAAGARGVAVCGAILGSAEPQDATRELLAAVQDAKESRHGTH